MKKFMDHTSIGMVENNMIVWIELRFAEVVLNYAEASLELGDIEAASTHINMIRGRTGLPDFTGDIKDALRHERKVELRSEEHTSELQSRENLVCRLLLEKKKTRK